MKLDVTQKRQIAMLLFAFVALALAAFLVARYWQAAQPGYERIAATVDCDLRAGPCRRDLAEGLLVFAISPRDIPLMQPLTLLAEVKGQPVQAVTVEIRGLNMDMGLNRTRLNRLPDGRWRGETILPICSQRRMRWEAAVQISGNTDVEVPFSFDTTRP